MIRSTEHHASISPEARSERWKDGYWAHKESVLVLLCRVTTVRLDSSVGRASDWRSEGPWFNPGSRHIFKCQKSKPQVVMKRFLILFSRGITKTPLATVATMFWKLENPGIDPGASRMQIERSTTWANPPCEFCVFRMMWLCEYGRFRNFVSDFGQIPPHAKNDLKTLK